MKKMKLLFMLLMAIPMLSFSQLVINTAGADNIIDFNTTVPGVNFGEFAGLGFLNDPTDGYLDADAWEIKGMSDLAGIKDFGIEATTGDYARGASPSYATTGGLYAFNSWSTFLGFQASGSDMTPGSITLEVENNTGIDVNSFKIQYYVWTINNANRSTSFNLSWSTDNVTFVNDTEHLFTTIADSSAVPEWEGYYRIINANITIPAGGFIYFKWTTDDMGGAETRDEIAIDDINVILYAAPIADCSPIATFPWTEDFESYTNLNETFDYCWQYRTGILSTQTMFSDTENSDYFYLSSFANTGDNALAVNIYTDDVDDWVISPAFDLGDGSVHYIMSLDMALTDYYSTTQGSFEVDDYYAILISTDGGTTWDPANTLKTIDSETDNIPAIGTLHIIDLGAYTGIVKFAFYGVSTIDGGQDIEIFVDNLSIYELSGCLDPYGAFSTVLSPSSVLINWQDLNSGSTFVLEYGAIGFTPGIGAGTIITDISAFEYTLTELASADYDYYIQSVCSPTESSAWSGPFSFSLLEGANCGTAFNYGMINDAASFNTIESSESHWYSVTLDQSYDGVLFSTCNSDFDTKINVYSDCDTEIGYNDDDDYAICTNDLNSTVYYQSLPAGVYYVRVYGYDATELGDYTLEVTSDNTLPMLSVSGTDFYESNDNDGTISNSIIITLDGDEFTNVGNLLTDGDDYYVSYVPSGLTFEVFVLSTTQVSLSYTGIADSHTVADNTTFDFNFYDPALVSNNSDAVVNNYQNIDINFTDVTLTSDLALLEPSSGYNCELTETSSIPYMVENSGTSTITAGTTFTLYLESESIVMLTEEITVDADITPGNSQFGFTTNTVDLSAIGTVIYKGFIEYAEDINNINDTINGFIVHFDQAISFPGDDDMNDTIVVGSFPYLITAEVTYTPDSSYLTPDWTWIAGSNTNEQSAATEGWYPVLLNTDGCYTEDSVFIRLFVSNPLLNSETVVNIYPNPTLGRFNIEVVSPNNEATSIQILSMDGKLIHTEVVNSNGNLTKEYDISSYASGIYFVKVSSGTQTINRRLVKQ